MMIYAYNLGQIQLYQLIEQTKTRLDIIKRMRLILFYVEIRD